jgi:hypothetical protein
MYTTSPEIAIDGRGFVSWLRYIVIFISRRVTQLTLTRRIDLNGLRTKPQFTKENKQRISLQRNRSTTRPANANST